MSQEMLINVSEGEECRIALVQDGKLQELYMERTSSTSHVGNIYKGRVTNVEPSIQAAFVDFGLGRNGFLHISDLMPSYFGESGEEITEAVGRKISRRDRPPIQRCLRRGDEITVQIIKEGIGTKGPTLSTYLSIPGRILVMMPGMAKFGISRKIEDEDERRRLRGILDGLKPIDEVGFIIRTAGVGKSKIEIDRDLKYLTRLWENITKKLKQEAPVELYAEGDLVTRTVRDVFTSDVEKIVVDNKDVAKKIKEFFKISMPRTKNKVEIYEDTVPLFYKYNIEHELDQMYTRHVPLPSGGSLVIDSTEAVVAIDVNSGKFREHNDAEKTAFMTDMEAADEIPRQLKLRDLGGVIICDFIDLRFERNRRELEQRLHDNLKNDRAKTKVLRMSQFGIIEMTRQRMRPSLKRSIYTDCLHCKGTGLVKTPESMALDLMRKLAIAISDERVQRVELTVCPDVAMHLLNRKRAQLAELEADTEKKIVIRQDNTLSVDDQRLQLFDEREGFVFLEELGMQPTGGQYAPQVVRGEGRRDGGRRGGRNRNRGGQRRDGQGSGGEERDGDFADEASGKSVEAAEEEVEEESQVIDLNDANEPIGDAPSGMDDDRDSRYRRGGPRRDGGRNNQGRNNQGRGDQGRSQQGRDDQSRNQQGRNNQTRGEQGGQRRNEQGSQRRNDQDDQQRNEQPPSREERGSRGDEGASRNDERAPRKDERGARNDNRGPRGDEPGPRRSASPGRDSQAGGARRRGRRGRGRGGDKQQARHPFVIENGEVNGNIAPRSPSDHEPEEEFHEGDIPAPGNELPPPEPELDDHHEDQPGPGNEVPPSEEDAPADNEPKKRRRRRGGRRHRARRERQAASQTGEGGGAADDVVHDEDLAADTEGPDVSAVAQSERPTRTPPPRQPEPPVVRTGTSDKHLADDEPADDEAPRRRPRSFHDLDELPEDMD